MMISNLEFARKNHQRFDHVISLIDPGTDCGFIRSNHLVSWIEDTEFPNPVEHEYMRSEVSRILKYVDENLGVNDRLLVHCHAGVSRSGAIAWIILCKTTGCDLRSGFEALYKVSPQIWPNTVLMNIAFPDERSLIARINAEISARRGVE